MSNEEILQEWLNPQDFRGCVSQCTILYLYARTSTNDCFLELYATRLGPRNTHDLLVRVCARMVLELEADHANLCHRGILTCVSPNSNENQEGHPWTNMLYLHKKLCQVDLRWHIVTLQLWICKGRDPKSLPSPYLLSLQVLNMWVLPPLASIMLTSARKSLIYFVWVRIIVPLGWWWTSIPSIYWGLSSFLSENVVWSLSMSLWRRDDDDHVSKISSTNTDSYIMTLWWW